MAQKWLPCNEYWKIRGCPSETCGWDTKQAIKFAWPNNYQQFCLSNIWLVLLTIHIPNLLHPFSAYFTCQTNVSNGLAYEMYTSFWYFPAGTIAGLRDDIKHATEALIKAKTSTVSVSSGCELFLRFITLTSLEQTVRREGRRRGEVSILILLASRWELISSFSFIFVEFWRVEKTPYRKR